MIDKIKILLKAQESEINLIKQHKNIENPKDAFNYKKIKEILDSDKTDEDKLELLDKQLFESNNYNDPILNTIRNFFDTILDVHSKYDDDTGCLVEIENELYFAQFDEDDKIIKVVSIDTDKEYLFSWYKNRGRTENAINVSKNNRKMSIVELTQITSNIIGYLRSKKIKTVGIDSKLIKLKF